MFARDDPKTLNPPLTPAAQQCCSAAGGCHGTEHASQSQGVKRSPCNYRAAHGALQVFPYMPGIKGMQHVHVAGFRLDQILKLILTTPVQVRLQHGFHT